VLPKVVSEILQLMLESGSLKSREEKREIEEELMKKRTLNNRKIALILALSTFQHCV
jgi:hypothetical protein